MFLSSSEITTIICTIIFFVIGYLFYKGRIDGLISISGFSKENLNKNFNSSIVRKIKAYSVFSSGIVLFFSLFIPHCTLFAMLVLLVADPIMLLFRIRS